MHTYLDGAVAFADEFQLVRLFLDMGCLYTQALYRHRLGAARLYAATNDMMRVQNFFAFDDAANSFFSGFYVPHYVT